MSTINKTRIDSLDILKGLVMVIMALDHVRDFFHVSAFYYDPTDPTKTSLAIFFTRWVTHFCAPTFCFLAGTSAFLVGLRKTKAELSLFLLKRGLWLVFIELTIVNFAWYFDVQFHSPGLLVIWSLGISMICLAALIHLPLKWILIFSCAMIFGHDLFDKVHFEGNYLWAILHDGALISLSSTSRLYIFYPVIPWIGVMSLGYYFGTFYTKSFDASKRKKLLNTVGLTSIILFFVLRFINTYGNPYPWVHYGSTIKSVISFMNPNKYPPSLLYLLMTLGAALTFLAHSEKISGKIANFFKTFGRVPFFYYILHLYAIHLVAMLFAELTGFGWHAMILTDWVGEVPQLKGFGFTLIYVYIIWVCIILLLYPACKWFDNYKLNNKDKWWLSYL